ncbi:MAG TPA: hypothetical protein VJS91_03620 [Nitrososphaeraceae archaeon]|nr:hypothetical protein [Nitrososphaeraceae archaeon]
MNEHSFENDPEVLLFFNLNNGSRITPDNFDQFKQYVSDSSFVRKCEINNPDEIEKLQYILKKKYVHCNISFQIH